MTGTSGVIPLNNGHTFRWMRQGARTPEIYGWVEKDYTVINGTGGFWRTNDPQEAVKRLKQNFPEYRDDQA